MFTENGVMIDLEQVRQVVEECDVFTIGFRLFQERVIVDSRTFGDEGPMLEVVEPVSTVEERFFWLGQRRPAFGVPERFTFFVWPHSIHHLEESGLMDRIRHRIYPLDGSGEMGRAVAKSVLRLHLLERKATRDAITGKNYHTIWAKSE
jgi:hypothetical protein